MVEGGVRVSMSETSPTSSRVGVWTDGAESPSAGIAGLLR